MIITHVEDGRRLLCHQPYPRADYVLTERSCECGSTGVRGTTGAQREGDYGYRSNAVCIFCGKEAGTLHVQVSTLFGLDEDERVLEGRCRVYDAPEGA